MYSRIHNKLFSGQLRLNILSGPVSTGIGIVVSVVTYPLYLHFLGYKQYGIWLLLASIITFAQIGLLGIGPAITKIVSEELGRGKPETIQEYFVTAMMVVTIGGLLMIVFGFLFRVEFISLIGIELSDYPFIEFLFVFMVVFSVCVVAYQVVNSTLAGLGRIDIANYSQTASQIIPLFFSVPLLVLDHGIYSLLIANMLSYSSIFLINLRSVKKLAGINVFMIASFSIDRLFKLIRLGGTVFAGSMFNLLLVPFTKIGLARTVGLDIVPVFEVAYRASFQVRGLFEVAFRAIMPEISRLISKNDDSGRNGKVKLLVTNAYKLLFISAPPVYLILIIFADYIIKIWLGASFNPAIPNTFRIMLVVSFISLVGVIPYYCILGRGFAKEIFIHYTIMALTTALLITITFSIKPILYYIGSCYLIGTAFGTGYLIFVESKEWRKTKISLR